MRRDLKNEIYELDSIMESNLRLLKADQAVTAENKQNILDFIDDSKSRGLSQNRIILSLQHLRRLSRFTSKNYKQFTVYDSKQLIKALEASKYGQWTKATGKALFKLLMRTLGQPKESYEWISVSKPPNGLKKEDLLTPDEIRRLIIFAPDNMWRSLLSLLGEVGCRPGEALNLTVGSVIVNSDHIKLYVAGKMAEQKYDDEIKTIVMKRLQAIPPNVTFSIGEHGRYTRDELISHVEKGTSVGKAAVEMQLNFIRKMTTIATQG